MSNTADKEAYLKKKQELLDELKKRKKQIIFLLKERYEDRKKAIPKNEAEKELLEKAEKSLIEGLTSYTETLKQEIERFKQDERKAELDLYPYDKLLSQLPKWFNDESILFEKQTEINFLQKKSMNLFAVILIGGILLTAGYYALSFISQSKKTK